MNSNYIYQTIHTLSHHPLAIAEHCRILEQNFFDIYLRPIRLFEQEIEQEIIELLDRERVTRTLSVFVELRLDAEQEQEILLSGTSIYDGYAMRSLSPRAQLVVFDSPFSLHPSSARREALNFADDIARNLGGEIALECGKDGTIRSMGGATLFAVVGRRLIASNALRCHERSIILVAAKELGLECEERSIHRSELPHFDELFGCDHQGVIAASSYGEHLYLKIIAKKIASHLAQPFL